MSKPVSQQRRHLMLGTLAGAASLATGLLPMFAAAATPAPLKVGLIVPISGPFASTGRQIDAAVRLFLQQHGDTVAGRKIEVIVKDDGGVAPDVTKRLAQELVARDKVEVLAGFDMADEGAGRRPLPDIKGHPQLAIHVMESLVNDEFDMAVFQDRPLDHGCNSPLSLMWPHEPAWPGAIVPIAINVLQYPLPTAARCYKLGKAVRRAVESYPEDLTVAIVGTGGLSHQIHGERTGFNNIAWDEEFLRLIVEEPETRAKMRHAELVELGGAESAEVIMWLAMRGALNDNISCVHQNHYLATTTNMAVAIYEQGGDDRAPAEPVYGNPQLAGLDALEGTYPFDLKASIHAARLNRFFWRHREPAFRALVANDPNAAFDELQLNEEERGLVTRQDWLGLVKYGVSFFVLEKFARVVKMSNLAVYAKMRGETLEEFLKTRRVPESA